MKNFKRFLFISFLLSTSVFAAVSGTDESSTQKKSIKIPLYTNLRVFPYKDSKGKVYEGYLSMPQQLEGPESKGKKAPAILIVHDWMGPSDFTREKADRLAKAGWIALTVDVYGKGVRPTNQDEAAKLAEKYKGDRGLLQTRMKTAYDVLKKNPKVDQDRIVVMGYCFGGTAALELARSGVPLAGTVTFHGGLSNPHPENTAKIHGEVLVLHGADDPYVTPKEAETFRNEMSAVDKKTMMVVYPGAVHGFTNPMAGSDPKKGMAYQEKADHASWEQFMMFLRGIEKK